MDYWMGRLFSPLHIRDLGLRLGGSLIHNINSSPCCFSPLKDRMLNAIQHCHSLPNDRSIDPLCNYILLLPTGSRDHMLVLRGGQKFLDSMRWELPTISWAKCLNLHFMHCITLRKVLLDAAKSATFLVDGFHFCPRSRFSSGIDMILRSSQWLMCHWATAIRADTIEDIRGLFSRVGWWMSGLDPPQISSTSLDGCGG